MGKFASFHLLPNRTVFHSLPNMSDNPFPFSAKKRKKVDLEALNSPLNRIPGMDLASVRDLLDLGFQQIEELKGRSPEVLFEEVLKLKEQIPPDRLNFFRMAVYFSESDDPDPQLMEAWKWS